MTFLDKDAKTLSQLGLTVCQAKIYLALVQEPNSTIKAISQASKVAREHVYQTMESLHELGLVEKTITVPVMFEAIPIKEAISSLIERRTKELANIQTEATELIRKYTESRLRTPTPKNEPNFILIPDRKANVLRLKKLVDNAQKTWDGMVTWAGLMFAMFNDYDVWKQAIDRGVTIRHLIDKPKEKKQLEKALLDFKKYPLHEVRYVRTPPPIAMAIMDKKEVIISTSRSYPRWIEKPGFWSDNPNLVELAQNYYDTMWNKAQKNL